LFGTILVDLGYVTVVGFYCPLLRLPFRFVYALVYVLPFTLVGSVGFVGSTVVVVLRVPTLWFVGSTLVCLVGYGGCRSFTFV